MEKIKNPRKLGPRSGSLQRKKKLAPPPCQSRFFFLCILQNLLRSFDEFSDFVIFESILIEYFAQMRIRMAPRIFFAVFRAIWSEFCYEVASVVSRKKITLN